MDKITELEDFLKSLKEEEIKLRSQKLENDLLHGVEKLYQAPFDSSQNMTVTEEQIKRRKYDTIMQPIRPSPPIIKLKDIS